MTTTTPLGVAPLCAVTATPEEYVGGAARAGFDFIGVRLSPVTAADVVYTPGGTAFRHLQRLVADHGIRVLDIEVFSIRPQTTREDWLPILEMAGELGARLYNVVGDEPDLGAFAAKVAELTADAAPYGITPVIEPIAYRPMNSYPRAVSIAREAGCGVELDALHVVRTGADVSIVADNRDLFPVLQLCDAPAELKIWDPRPAEANPGDDDMVIESRLNRLFPGEGAAPLSAMRDAVAPGTPIALEIPNIAAQAGRSYDEYFALLHRAGTAFAAGVPADV